MNFGEKHINLNAFQKCSAIFILFAFVFMIAHNVIPHLHHDQIICLPTKHTTQCDDKCTEHDFAKISQHQIQQHPEHHHHGNFTDCGIEKILKRNNGKQSIERITKIPLFQMAFLVVSRYSLELVPTKSIQFWDVHPDIFYHFLFCKSIGLRAPPIA